MKATTMGFWIFISLFFAIGFGLLGWGLFSLYKAKVAEGWPQTRGTISTCELVEETGSDGSVCRVKVSYTFEVAGRIYQGDRIAFGYTASSTCAEHTALHARLDNAVAVSVRYNPLNPAEAVLGAGLSRTNLSILVFAGVWLIFTTGFTTLWMMSNSHDSILVRSIQVIEQKKE